MADASLVLTGSPSLAPLLARGALLSPFKRPAPDAEFPRTRLLLPGLRVDLARLAAYERVCGFPTGQDALPLTYPHVLGFPLAMRLMSGRDFPLPLLGLVHTSITITRHRAMPATGAHELTVYVEGLAPHRRGTEATVVTEVREDGDVVWESRSTYLARHRTRGPAGEHREAAGTPREATGTPGDVSRAPREGTRPPRGEAVAPRDEAGTPREEMRKPLPAVAEWRLAGDVGRRYGAASGDRNPIHLHPLTARLFGFPRAIAHGMWTVARCLAAHGTPDSCHVRAEFRAPVLLPGTVTYGAQDGRFELRGREDRIHLSGDVYST
ncbi:MaoC/PaaZ C-terminal domain-containing protein [Streptomyces africanus]|uniref:MaoC/PaaZ C-terminal domain-containing protein n=1 Tax=Streptomyces africanus TaxID=231024 RepID=UPI000A3C069E|nr:MaoC/PaaZ C-terminal domain-containing protein [Streptomyces africanus]